MSLVIPEDAHERWKVYGPYTAKDGRQRVVIVEKRQDGTTIKQTRSYPKYLADTLLPIPLDEEDTIDHVDRDFTNNDPFNLRVVDRSTHASHDAVRVRREAVCCQGCGTSFIPIKEQGISRSKQKAGPFCSRSCSGRYGASIQNGGEKIERVEVVKEYYRSEKVIG